MAVGKNKIIVDATNYKKSADPFRTVTGKYWTRERESQFSLLKKGFKPDAGAKLSDPGCPFEIVFTNTPQRNEEAEFYEFEQDIILRADAKRLAGESDPTSVWEALVKKLLTDDKYSDHAFSVELPYSEKELKLLNIKQKVNSADIKPIYNFYIEGYEEEIVEQKMPEQLLPNLYVFMQAEKNGRTAYNIQDDDLDGLISLGDTIPKKMQQITKKRRKALNEPTRVQDPSDKYYKDYGKYYKKFADNNKRRLSRMRQRYSTISFTNDVIENIAEYNEKKYIFPMYTDIRFTTDRATYVAELLKEAGLNSSFMNYVIKTESESKLPRVRFAEAHKRIKQIKNKKLENKAKMETLFRVKNLATIDLLDWWERYSDQQTDAPGALSSMSMMIGQGQKPDDGHSKVRNAYLQQVLDTVFQSKFRKFIKNFTRSYQSVLNGDLSYSETLMYKVQKFLGNPVGKPIQTFYTCNSNAVEDLSLLDTQVKYDIEYTYVITAYQMVLGTEYEYSNISTGGWSGGLMARATVTSRH